VKPRPPPSLEHDYIVPILHVGEDGGVPYIVMPFLRGMPLSDHLLKDQPLPILEIIKIGREMAEALAAAHDHAMVHREIKPVRSAWQP
jgi:serine/threonine protein kinase